MAAQLQDLPGSQYTAAGQTWSEEAQAKADGGSGTWLSKDEKKNLQGKDEYVKGLVREQEDLERQARSLATGNPISNTPEAQRLAKESTTTTLRSGINNAAERGLIHSGALGSLKAQSSKLASLQNLQLQAQEEALRRESAKNIAAGQQAAKQALEGVPESVRANRTFTNQQTIGLDIPVYEGQRDVLQRSQNEVDTIIGDIAQKRPTEEQLRSSFSDAIDKEFATQEAQALAFAQERGLSADQLAGIQSSFARNKEAAFDVADGMVQVLSSYDPSLMRAELAALYNKDILPDLEKNREQASPYWAVGMGLLGAGIGGLVGGGVPGATLGYTIGSSAGSVLFQ